MVDRLHAALEPTVNGLGYDLWGVERSRSGDSQLLRLYIDHAEGITVDDCEVVSRQVGDVLEAEQLVRGDYTLEVSSPGLDRVLFTLEQHRRYVGHEVQLRMRDLVQGRRRLHGRLCAIADDALVVEADGEQYEVPFSAIERSRLVPELPRARPPR
ncbi:MAG: ribosome maturation factor RimP [Gammaproteobacteria bacterium]|nr:ribosome maturation factor RimP [Gammaproteobacteria bacterium]MCP5202063.1 ribosome maturation factor RimP [Gammaproteobacteria bacterium]